MNLERRKGRTRRERGREQEIQKERKRERGRERELREASHCLFDAGAFEWRPPLAKSTFASAVRGGGMGGRGKTLRARKEFLYPHSSSERVTNRNLSPQNSQDQKQPQYQVATSQSFKLSGESCAQGKGTCIPCINSIKVRRMQMAQHEHRRGAE